MQSECGNSNLEILFQLRIIALEVESTTRVKSAHTHITFRVFRPFPIDDLLMIMVLMMMMMSTCQKMVGLDWLFLRGRGTVASGYDVPNRFKLHM